MTHTIIIGAGLGGLALAQGLKRAGLSCAIFERDPNALFRPQGYRLRINPDGSGALKEVLPESTWNLFRDSSAKMEFGFASFDPISGEFVGRKTADPGKRMGGDATNTFTCDRTVLRSVLMVGLDDVIQYSKEFVKYSTTSSGKVRVDFADGTHAEGDLLVGADGVHSRVRQQLVPSLVPVDTTARIIFGKTVLTPELIERFPKQALESMTVAKDAQPLLMLEEPIRFACDPITLCLSLPSVKDYVYWILIAKEAVFGHEDKLFTFSREQVKELSLSLTKNWHPSIRSLLELQEPEQTSVLRMCSAPPTIPSWPASQVTLLGDAVHVMLPAGGQGANTALRDAGALTQAIIRGARAHAEGAQGALLGEIAAYDTQMREWGGQAIANAFDAGRQMFGQIPYEECKPLVYK